ERSGVLNDDCVMYADDLIVAVDKATPKRLAEEHRRISSVLLGTGIHISLQKSKVATDRLVWLGSELDMDKGILKNDAGSLDINGEVTLAEINKIVGKNYDFGIEEAKDIG
ncbi:MAG: hypothetical protein M1834_000791, partial [Cirrosporium novae-zelandiae]